ncbi:PAS domain S-box protein [Haloarcula salina]|uniref:PAS domain-containing sensor histidine kinase n=1 Tax=Haloarcula salina TaxID=1429914 RepID=UPI003C6EEEE1
MTDSDPRPDEATAVVADAPVGITVFDTEPALVSVNDRFLALTGYDRSTLLDRSYRAFLGPETAADAVERLDRAIAERVPATVELKVHRQDGSTFWDRLRLTPLAAADGTVTGFSMFHEDVTALRTQRGSLEALNRFASRVQSEANVDAICDRTVEAAADILDFDMCTVMLRDGEWLVPRATSKDAPPGGSRRMRLDQGLAGLTYRTGASQVVADIDRDENADPAKPTYKSGLSVPVGDLGVFQAVMSEVDGFETQDVELAELLARHTATAIERVEREQHLRRQNERLDEFADVVSHDLRNPLSVLEGSLELAQRTGEATHFERSKRAVDRMSQLVEGLLALARRGDDVGDLCPIALSDVAETAWAHVETGEAALSVETTLVVEANEARLTQLFENLFRNAVEHGSTSLPSQAPEDPVEHGSTSSQNASRSDDAAEHCSSAEWTASGDERSTLHVRVADLDVGTGFAVEDDGVGIRPEDRANVLRAGYSTAADGTGQGLAISKRIAEGHGWTLAVGESREGGARFEISGVDVLDSP